MLQFTPAPLLLLLRPKLAALSGRPIAGTASAVQSARLQLEVGPAGGAAARCEVKVNGAAELSPRE